MEGQTAFLGLPIETLLIVGGLYLTATVLPSVVALILKRKEEEKQK